LNPGIWIAIYLPIFVLLFVIIPYQKKKRFRIVKRKRRLKREVRMSKEIVVKYLNKKCKVYLGMGEAVKGVIKSVEDNWMEVETSKGIQLVNLDYAMNIKFID